MHRVAQIAAISLVTAVPLAGCGSDDAPTTAAPTTDAAELDAPGTSEVARALPPVIVDGPEDLDVEVGAAIDIVTEGVVSVSSSDESVLGVSQPSDDGSATYNAGAVALSTGRATLTVSGADGATLYEVAVEVS